MRWLLYSDTLHQAPDAAIPLFLSFLAVSVSRMATMRVMKVGEVEVEERTDRSASSLVQSHQACWMDCDGSLLAVHISLIMALCVDSWSALPSHTGMGTPWMTMCVHASSGSKIGQLGVLSIRNAARMAGQIWLDNSANCAAVYGARV